MLHTPPYRLEMLGGCILVPGNISGPTAADTGTLDGFFSRKIKKTQNGVPKTPKITTFGLKNRVFWVIFGLNGSKMQYFVWITSKTPYLVLVYNNDQKSIK